MEPIADETAVSEDQARDISPPVETTHTSTSALQFLDFRLLFSGVGLATFGQQMLSVAIGWELYIQTKSALVLGGVGLAQVIPLIILFLPAGYIADRVNRKYIVLVAQLVNVLASLSLALLSYLHGPLVLIYCCLAAIGGAQSFSQPANSALVSQVIPEAAYENAMTWRSSINQLSAVIGPAAGGFLIGFFQGATPVYLLSSGFFLTFAILLIFIHVQPQKRALGEGRKLSSLVSGVRFLGQTKVMLAAITLDLFAVLFGGSVALLPIYATGILHVGPVGLGWLQAADSIGGIAMALFLARRPPFKRAGPVLLLGVAGFGLATIVFGLSHWFWLSFLALIFIGAFDNISVVIRSTLALVRTPDEMRGRVSAVNSLFIGTSNQLGGFESGLTAQLLGPVAAVVAGGIGTLLVVLIVAGAFPDIRRLTTLRETPQE
ncbi:MFS transporter [Ktedonobacter racemifer]|uniref:Major facilitator superfamily MFS_1 n=1 Tax=Ktedonobacter racemifer DSM 44963 TaxID=485913 RepID=D6TTC7_KTERA|nr:MFS transporter [Ktedonobacter racemifer]EFH83678.1 major facilitator superfamily MFS_1 [Ktedonobacter racemifer DSM 44963]